MYVLNIPAIAEFKGGNRTYQVKMSYVMDTEMFNKYYSETPGGITIGDYSDLPINTDIPKLINQVFSDYMGRETPVINNDLHYYAGVKEGDTINKKITNSFTYLGLNIDYITGLADVPNTTQLTSLKTLNDYDFYTNWYYRNYDSTRATVSALSSNTYSVCYLRALPAANDIDIIIAVFPEDIFDSDGNLDVQKYIDAQHDPLQLQISIRMEGDHFEWGLPIQYDDKDVSVHIQIGRYFQLFENMVSHIGDFNLKKAGAQLDDPTDPFNPGRSYSGGGDGTMPPGGIDNIDPAEIPDLPSISAADLGFITIYKPTVAQLKALSSYMWSNAFDLNAFKKLFSDPMDCIIGLAIVPVSPAIAGSKNVHFGTIDSGINMPYIASNYYQLDCGSVELYKYVGCFMDNDPYTKIQIYLPFIGFRQLSADDLIGGSIQVVYNIDVLTGACAAFIKHSTRGVLYSYNGSCITNVPLTAVNFSGAIQNAVSAIGSMVGIAAGMSTGAAPITAMSAAGLMTSAANTALNSKQQVQRSGNLGGSAGILSILRPYVVIERPNMSVPANVEHYTGQTSNITMNLGTCSGFTMCEYVHVDGVSATSEEITEIESLLKAGVIL